MKSIKTALLAVCLLATGLIAPPLHAQNFTFSAIAGGTQGSADGSDSNAQFYNPTGVAVDSGGNVYVADQQNNIIRKITPLGTNWIVTTIAGGTSGALDGTNNAAQFSGPTGIAVDSATNLYVADQLNYTIRKITPAGTNWVTSTLAGQAGSFGTNNGTNAAAQFHNPTGVALDNAGNIYVADEFNNAIRKITPNGTNWIVTTIAGGTQGSADGANSAAQFFDPFGVAVDATGRVFVGDQFNNTIRLITAVTTNWVVTTIAGQTIAGFSNGLGTNALFDTPLGIAVDTNDNVYVMDLFNNAIRELTPSATNWMVSTIGGGTQGSNNGAGTNARFDFPFGVAADAYGDIFVADFKNNAIRLGVSSVSPPPTGGLSVMITPSNAVSAGAQWQLDGAGPFQTNGALLSGLVPGGHVVSFNTAAGFTTPASQTVIVTARQTTLSTGNYATAIADAGSLQVMILPEGSVDAGALWQVDSGAWQTNEAIVAGLSVGDHTLSFNTVTGWTTPSSQTVAITNTLTTLATGNYVTAITNAGSLQVMILPEGSVDAGAQWQVDNGAWQTNEAIVAGLSVGAHTLSFNTVTGWTTPSSQTVAITNSQTTAATGNYVTAIADAGSLQVMISPEGSVDVGALWQVDSGAWQTNEAIVAGLSVGAHTLSFNTVTGWTTPANQTVAVTNSETTAASGIYEFQSNSLQMTILPSFAAIDGAQWQVDGGTNQNSGTTLFNLSTGNHTLSFTPVFGWNTPADQTVTTTNGAFLSASGNYTPLTTPGGELLLVTNGNGTIRHEPWPDTLVIGKQYTMTAVPMPGCAFSNWTGGAIPPYSLEETSARYTFTMQSNLVLKASFVTNVFLAAQGAYRGLFAPTNYARQQASSGSFLFNITSSGTVYGNLALDGQTVWLSGKFNLGGAARIVSQAAPGQLSLTTTLQLDFTNQSISGTVSNSAFTAALDGDRDVFGDSHRATEFEGHYTLIIPGTNNPSVGPFGVSYGTVRVNSLGAITLVGSLADGTPISLSSVVSKDGYWPFYLSLYGGKGSLWGWNYFTNHTITAIPSFSWINETNSAKKAVYRSGFTNQQATLTGGLAVSPFAMPDGFTAALLGGNLPSAISITNFSENTTQLTLKANKMTGVISGSFANPAAPEQTVKINGVILPGQTNAAGYFLGTNQSGAFTLDPP